jgi:hypothetical protein
VEWIDLKTSALCERCRELISVMKVTAASGART